MYPYHEVMAMFDPDIEFYVADVKPSSLGLPLITLTILTNSLISRRMQQDIEEAVQEAMSNNDCARLAHDLGWPDPIDEVALLHVEVRYWGEKKQ